MNEIARNRLGTLIVATMVVMSGCSSGKEASKAHKSDTSLVTGVAAASALARDRPGGLPPEARVALDSGNGLYRAKRYPEALAQYRLAAKRAPDDVSGIFGVYMVADKMKNRSLAESALVVLRARGMVAPPDPHAPPTDSTM